MLDHASNTHSGVQVVPSLAIHDTMRYVGSDVSTLAFGGAMGMMGFLLAVGAKVCMWLYQHVCTTCHPHMYMACKRLHET